VTGQILGSSIVEYVRSIVFATEMRGGAVSSWFGSKDKGGGKAKVTPETLDQVYVFSTSFFFSFTLRLVLLWIFTVLFFF
jgi:hypothetical protein